MPIYDKPVRVLISDMIYALAPKLGQHFPKDAALEWFAHNYSKIKEGTITAHLIRFSTNAPSRLHYSVKTDTLTSQEKFVELNEVQSPSKFAYESDL